MNKSYFFLHQNTTKHYMLFFKIMLFRMRILYSMLIKYSQDQNFFLQFHSHKYIHCSISCGFKWCTITDLTVVHMKHYV